MRPAGRSVSGEAPLRVSALVTSGDDDRSSASNCERSTLICRSMAAKAAASGLAPGSARLVCGAGASEGVRFAGGGMRAGELAAGKPAGLERLPLRFSEARPEKFVETRSLRLLPDPSGSSLTTKFEAVPDRAEFAFKLLVLAEDARTPSACRNCDSSSDSDDLIGPESALAERGALAVPPGGMMAGCENPD